MIDLAQQPQEKQLITHCLETLNIPIYAPNLLCP